MLRLDERNKTWSRAYESNSPFQDVDLLATDDIVISAMGQSFAAGSGSWYPLSREPVSNAWVYGPSVADAGKVGKFVPAAHFDGSETRRLFPLIGQAVHNGRLVPHGSEEDVIPQHKRTNTGGDGPIVSLTRSVAASHPGKRFFAAQAAFGGTPIVGLMKSSFEGAERWAHWLDLLKLYRDESARDGRTVSAPVIYIDHGQSDYAGDKPTSLADRRKYATALRAWMSDMTDAVMEIFPDQVCEPVFLLSTPGNRYVENLDRDGRPGLSIHEAMYEVADSDTRVMLLPGSYAGGDAGGAHLDTNGYRLMGEQAAKVFEFVREGGRFMAPRIVQTTKTTSQNILVHFHVPVPPLRFAEVVRQGELRMDRKKGFVIMNGDCTKTFQIDTVEQVADTIIRIRMVKDLQPDSLLVLGGKRPGMSGKTNICDSDDTPSANSWGAIPGSGMRPGEPLASLVGRPYNLSSFALPHLGPLNWRASTFKAV